MTDAKGDFAIQNVNKGKIQVVISCLGYVTATHEIEIHSDTTDLKFYLEQNSLMLDDVEITAKVNENSATTSRTIDRTAMDHMQMVNVSDLMALMPGGKTINPNLTTSPRFEIRTGGESGASFGTWSKWMEYASPIMQYSTKRQEPVHVTSRQQMSNL